MWTLTCDPEFHRWNNGFVESFQWKINTRNAHVRHWKSPLQIDQPSSIIIRFFFFFTNCLILRSLNLSSSTEGLMGENIIQTFNRIWNCCSIKTLYQKCIMTYFRLKILDIFPFVCINFVCIKNLTSYTVNKKKTNWNW